MYTALRTFCPLRPTRFDCEAMTLPEMTVRAMDEIVLRIEISGRGGGGIQRATFKRARRGYGRDKRGPPHSKKNRDKGVNGEWAAFWRLA